MKVLQIYIHAQNMLAKSCKINKFIREYDKKSYSFCFAKKSVIEQKNKGGDII